ncbi:unnamed protein product [Rhizoctonia solani]|uniref:Uncharacterized protein n=1 Tax=Rhizoctonia solani TaxID=456999 RepID=A0A8H3BRD5_9AGAM|nr:unnamed protein product [Rhizoctonia solani]
MIHQRTADLIRFFAERPIHTSFASESNTMSVSHAIANASVVNRHPPLPAKSVSGPTYLRRYAYAPEVLPLVGVVMFAVSMGLYFSADAGLKNDVQWQPRTQPWLQTPTKSVRWDGAGGIQEMIQKEYRAAKEKAKKLIQ